MICTYALHQVREFVPYMWLVHLFLAASLYNHVQNDFLPDYRLMPCQWCVKVIEITY